MSKSLVETLVDAERRRQWETLVLIPSESICHPDAAAMLASPLSNIYAEGQPAPPLMHDPRQAASDAARFASWQTRLADGRYYRGCVNANRAELLAHKFIAEAYAALKDSPAPEDIHVCVQALSGAPANIAVYEALLEHGDRILALDLSHGGHLTHGSEFNYSGKTFRVTSYGIKSGNSLTSTGRSSSSAARPHIPGISTGPSCGPSPTTSARIFWRTSPTSRGWSSPGCSTIPCPTRTWSPTRPTRRCAGRAAPSS